MKQSIQAFILSLFFVVLCIPSSRGEIADAVYRNKVEFKGLAVNWHAALTYRYDNHSKTRYVIEADSDIVRVGDDWATFLGNTGGTLQKQACPANLSLGMRQVAIQYATEQAGTPYWNVSVAIAAG